MKILLDKTKTSSECLTRALEHGYNIKNRRTNRIGWARLREAIILKTIEKSTSVGETLKAVTAKSFLWKVQEIKISEELFKYLM